MALDPNIALNIRPLEVPNQLAQYGQLAQIQNAQNQNALAQYQLSAAQRADEQQTNLYSAARKPDFKLDFQTAIQYGAPGIAAFKAQQESSKTQGEIDAQVRKAALDRADAFSTALAPLVTNVQAGKPLTHNDVFAQANRLVAQGLLRKEDLGSIPMNTAELPSFVMNMATSTENSRKALQTYQPEALVAGGNVINKNPLAAGGIGKVIAPVSMTAFDAARLPILQQQANTAGGQLGLAREKFNWEQANPGYELKESQDGSIVGVNKRTLQAFPVMLGQTAPAPAAQTGVPGARLPAATTGQVIPGMTSVLDQPPVAPMAPLKGKDSTKTAVSEQQASYNIGRVLTAASQINEIGKKDPKAIKPGGGEALATSVGMSGTANLVRNANRQIVYGAQRDALDALLYLATGAAYNKEQFESQVAAYIPQYTDEPEAVTAKKARMTELIKSAKTRAGKAWTPEMDSAMKALAAPVATPASASAVAPPPGFKPD
jgi:hypothetical protein